MRPVERLTQPCPTHHTVAGGIGAALYTQDERTKDWRNRDGDDRTRPLRKTTASFSASPRGLSPPANRLLQLRCRIGQKHGPPSTTACGPTDVRNGPTRELDWHSLTPLLRDRFRTGEVFSRRVLWRDLESALLLADFDDSILAAGRYAGRDSRRRGDCRDVATVNGYERVQCFSEAHRRVGRSVVDDVGDLHRIGFA